MEAPVHVAARAPELARQRANTLALLTGEAPRLRRLACYLCRDADLADDLVQDTLARALDRLDQWTPGTNMRAWLTVILRSVYFSHLRREGRRPRLLPLAPGFDGVARGTCPEERLLAKEVGLAVDRLAPYQREVLLLCAVEGATYAQAAEKLDLPLNTVRSRLFRARVALAEACEVGAEPLTMQQLAA